jgi:hypothetical protein
MSLALFRRAAAAALLAASCTASTASGPQLIGEGRHVLFIGNSLTYVNDVPGIVQALADSARGDRLAVASVTAPDFALVDHWTAGAAQRAIASDTWEFVVLQQGPSSVEANRDTLRMFAAQFANEIAKAGGRAALYSAWPTRDRRQDFPRAIESYALAADDVHGIMLPVATAWLAAWDRDPSLQLYAADGLHASTAGSYLAALVIYARLLNRTPVGLPATLRLASGATISIDSSVAATLQAAAAQAVASVR